MDSRPHPESLSTSQNASLLLTLDLDWCPDFIIAEVADMLIERNIKATWFITHESTAVDKLREIPSLFEIGIHPNFLPGSTHGDSIDSVLETCMRIAPEARSMRTHGLMQSTLILEKVLELTPVKTDLSLFLPMQPYIKPFAYEWNNRTLFRIPFFWEDDFEMQLCNPMWTLKPLLKTGPGLKIFDFHPIHVFLNSRNASSYQSVKDSVTALHSAREKDLQELVCKESGTRTLFLELVDHIASLETSLRICDIK